MSGRPTMTAGRRLVYTADVLFELIGRDMKLRYRRSVFGIAWTLLNPLAELLVLLFVFGYVLPLRIPNYPTFLFTGILVYGWFQSSLFFAANTIVGSRELVRQPGFPIAILPIVTVASNLIHFLLALPVLLILLLWNDIQLSSTVVMLPVLLGLQFVLTLSLAYVVAACHVRFRDTQYLLKVLLQFLFYLSPIFYSVRDVPPEFQPIYQLNPLVYLIEAFRSILMRGDWPPLVPLLQWSAISIVMLCLGFAFFTHASRRFVEELG